ncbi:MAG TPA: type II toxin-antitoxin system RelE/ParE family toxin [Terracidiphilus sp.]|jgi:plasmid stabilization system protein ParE|nr:type II toxin-antitoxin system RelE/ParE family toxin [Terracidiphilus sp.]
MSEYVLSAGAESDLYSIWEFIAQDNIDAADRWVTKLFEGFEVLTRNPAIGHRRDDLTSFPVLFWPIGAYLVIYRIQDGHIEIVSVTQGARDIPSFLRTRVQ